MGWFQTLFVYLHAMPRATVRRIWDWWLSSGDFEASDLFCNQPRSPNDLTVLLVCPAPVNSIIHYNSDGYTRG